MLRFAFDMVNHIKAKRCKPGVNPIEQVFAKLKHLLRKAAESSKEAVWRKIGTLLDQFSPKECKNCLRNSGYGSV